MALYSGVRYGVSQHHKCRARLSIPPQDSNEEHRPEAQPFSGCRGGARAGLPPPGGQNPAFYLPTGDVRGRTGTEVNGYPGSEAELTQGLHPSLVPRGVALATRSLPSQRPESPASVSPGRR